MKILVTGSNGLLGQKITDMLLPIRDFELIATSTGPNRHPVRNGYSYVELDITDPERSENLLEAQRPDCVINTAAMTNVDACEDNPEACRKINVQAVHFLSDWCARSGTHLVHLSTDFIFDGLNSPYREDDIPNPLSVYGKSKLESEKIIRKSGCAATILRTMLVYGVVADMSRSNIVLWAKKALEKGEPIRVVDDQWRMPTLAEDLAAACLSAVKGRTEGVFHVSGPELLSVRDIVGQIADFWQLDQGLIRSISSAVLDQKAPRPPRTEFVLDKAKEKLNYHPTTFRQGLAVLDRQLKNVYDG